tara:strand:- start:468 stop:647 length:180 start_codon:yes stop_codon:yes gene_type:complete
MIKPHKSPVEDYENNLFLAVTDMFLDMAYDTDIDKFEARQLILGRVNIFLDDVEKELDN